MDNALTEDQLSNVSFAFEECLGNKDREFTHQLIEHTQLRLADPAMVPGDIRNRVQE